MNIVKLKNKYIKSKDINNNTFIIARTAIKTIRYIEKNTINFLNSNNKNRHSLIRMSNQKLF